MEFDVKTLGQFELFAHGQAGSRGIKAGDPGSGNSRQHGLALSAPWGRRHYAVRRGNQVRVHDDILPLSAATASQGPRKPRQSATAPRNAAGWLGTRFGFEWSARTSARRTAIPDWRVESMAGRRTSCPSLSRHSPKNTLEVMRVAAVTKVAR